MGTFTSCENPLDDINKSSLDELAVGSISVTTDALTLMLVELNFLMKRPSSDFTRLKATYA